MCVDLFPAAELVHDVVHELEQLVDQLARRALRSLLAEVDELAVDAVARGAPLVLDDERAAVLAEAQVLRCRACRA